MQSEDIEVIILKDFSVSTVRGLVKLLHGVQQRFFFDDLNEIEELLDILGIALSNRFENINRLLVLREKRKKKFKVDDDVIITFEKHNGSNKNCICNKARRDVLNSQGFKRRRTDYHTKPYTDWSKVAVQGLVIKDEPLEEITSSPVFQRVTYDKKYIKENLVSPEVQCISVSSCVSDGKAD